MDLRAFTRAMVAGGTIGLIVASGCGLPDNTEIDETMESGDEAEGELYGSRKPPKPPRPSKRPDASVPDVDASTPTPTVDAAPPPPPPPDASEPTPPTPTTSFVVRLVPDGVSGTQRINFAIPFAPGAQASADTIKVLAGTTERPTARRVLARHPDGSARSVQVQLDVDVSATTQLTVQLGAVGATGPALTAVSTTLTGSGTNVRPKVLVTLPQIVIINSGLMGPMVPSSAVAGTTLDAWTTKCDFAKWNTDAFVPLSTSRDVWLYDRVTALYRGYAYTGNASPLKSAYREATIYRDGMTISGGVTTGIAVPTASTDLKYHYAQGMALHYLFTGDDRFREAAEAVSARVANMWNPTYSGGFWTERHAGFALLAHEWAARVTDDQLTTISNRANTAATAFLNLQNASVANYTDTTARCFAHSGSAHGESWSYTGCSPWMSALIAEALDTHGRRVGGTRATEIRTSLAKLGRAVAKNGRDSIGRPLYWMGVGNSSDETDAYDEHWGEAAYVVALAWDATGRTDAALKTAADSLVAGFRSRGTVPHMRSFNWQCRAAVATPALLK